MLAALGFLCVAVGAVGVIVPGLPTTVFLLAACYLFARSFPRFDRALRGHRVFGAYIRMATDGMPVRAKILTVVLMWGAIAVSTGILWTTHIAVRVAVIAFGLAGTFVLIFHVRTKRREPDAR